MLRPMRFYTFLFALLYINVSFTLIQKIKGESTVISGNIHISLKIREVFPVIGIRIMIFAFF
ncbi:hypothetical protein WQ57_23545 [Mesobacillus campisalis]|uniref:Uncharacterized protein n=1 Tax=Mesobacillus campisalis TaxID=1408103 RepID=A0A0M2SFT7_9BACI|nr:hypothetical protein WQ57_23545 [Mesobacillus campisalis]